MKDRLVRIFHLLRRRGFGKTVTLVSKLVSMCINSITIPTRSRFISLLHRQPLLQTVSCGKCCECQSLLHQQWYYRIYHQWLDTVSNGGYVFFDTLTYSDDCLPHLSDFFDIQKGSDLDFPCFSRKDIRGFLTRLENRLRVKFGIDSSVFSRFLAAEYGTDENHTHRPHYHILFFVKSPSLDVYSLRNEVHNAWKCGLTDYVRTSGRKANYFAGSSNRSQLAVSNYVAKYVQKSSVFQDEINKRIDAYMDNFYKEVCNDVPVIVKSHVDIDNPDYHTFADEVRFCRTESSFTSSVTYKKERSRLVRFVDQFHLQSNGFGLSALNFIDLNDLHKTGMVTMPDCQKVVRKIPLPKYFERKLFEKLVYVGARRLWIPTEDGVLYRRNKLLRMVDFLAEKYKSLNEFFHLGFNVDFIELARYNLFYRGRYRGQYGNDISVRDVYNMSESHRVTNFCSMAERQAIGFSFVAHFDNLPSENFYFGRYCSPRAACASLRQPLTPLGNFIKRHAITDTYLPSFAGFDAILDKFQSLISSSLISKENLYKYKQDFKNRQYSLFV